MDVSPLLPKRRRSSRKNVTGQATGFGSYTRKRKRKPRFGATATVSGAVAQRSGARLAALGGTVKGVDGSDGYTGREARLIKKARRRQKDSKPSLSTAPVSRTGTPSVPALAGTDIDRQRLADVRRTPRSTATPEEERKRRQAKSDLNARAGRR